jgi:hypothetical protein
MVKGESTEVRSIRLPESMVTKLTVYAEARDRSVNWVVNEACTAFFDRPRSEPVPPFPDHDGTWQYEAILRWHMPGFDFDETGIDNIGTEDRIEAAMYEIAAVLRRYGAEHDIVVASLYALQPGKLPTSMNFPETQSSNPVQTKKSSQRDDLPVVREYEEVLAKAGGSVGLGWVKIEGVLVEDLHEGDVALREDERPWRVISIRGMGRTLQPATWQVVWEETPDAMQPPGVAIKNLKRQQETYPRGTPFDVCCYDDVDWEAAEDPEAFEARVNEVAFRGEADGVG